jgi:nicotinamide mononucleotide transporter
MSTILFTAWGYQVSILEALASITSFIGVGLGVTAKRITWPWWALSSALYGIFFLQAKLYASAALQIVFIIAAVWGWFGWEPKGAKPGALSHRNRALWIAGLLASTLALAPLLKSLGAASTTTDSFIFFGSLIAQVLMVYEKYESWPIWLVVDCVGTILYASLGYWFTSALYAAFTVIAALGWSRWYGSHRRAIRSL